MTLDQHYHTSYNEERVRLGKKMPPMQANPPRPACILWHIGESQKEIIQYAH